MCRPFLEALEDRTVPSTMIKAWVYEDLNGNGIRDPIRVGEPELEPGLPGWTVFLDGNQSSVQSANTVLDPGELSLPTGDDGFCMFENVPPPFFMVSRVLNVDQPNRPPGRWVPTTAGTVFASIPNENSFAEVEFGVQYREYLDTVPVAGETRANAGTAGVQGHQADYSGSAAQTVAADASGNIVVVWRSETDSSGNAAILARRFYADGSPLSGEIQVGTSNSAGMPRVAMADTGGFAVAWDTRDSATNNLVVYTRRYPAVGTPTNAVQVTPISNSTRNALTGIAMDADGDYAVLFSGGKKSGFSWNDGIIGFQRYNSAGQAVGNNTLVVDAKLINGNASIAMADNGNFVVVWDEVNSTNAVYAQRYTNAGKKTGGRIEVTSGTSLRWQSLVAMNGVGDFVVTWFDRSGGAFARVYNAEGSPLTAQVSVDAGLNEHETAAAIHDDGNVTFAWPSRDEILFARWVNPGASVPGDAYVVNTTTQGYQTWPAIALTGARSFVIAWNGYGVGDDAGVFFQRFGPNPATVDEALAAPLSGGSHFWGDVSGLLDALAGMKRREASA